MARSSVSDQKQHLEFLFIIRVEFIASTGTNPAITTAPIGQGFMYKD
jgi:hypothetical protein